MRWGLQHFGLDLATPDEYRNRSVVELRTKLEEIELLSEIQLSGSLFDPALEGETTEATLLGKIGHIELAIPVLRIECFEQVLDLIQKRGKHEQIWYFPSIVSGKDGTHNSFMESLRVFCDHSENIYAELKAIDRHNKMNDKEMVILGNSHIPHNVIGNPSEMMISVLPIPSILARSGPNPMNEKLNELISINNRLREICLDSSKAHSERTKGDLTVLLYYHVHTYFDNTLPGVPTYRTDDGEDFLGIAQLIDQPIRVLSTQSHQLGESIAGTSIQRIVRCLNSGERVIGVSGGTIDNLCFELAKQCAFGRIWPVTKKETSCHFIDAEGLIYIMKMEEIQDLVISPWSGERNLPPEVILSAKKSSPLESVPNPSYIETLAKISELDSMRVQRMPLNTKAAANFLFHEVAPTGEVPSEQKIVIIEGEPDNLLMSQAFRNLSESLGENAAFLFHTPVISPELEGFGRFEYKPTPDELRNVIIAIAELRTKQEFRYKIPYFDNLKSTELQKIAILMKHIPRTMIQRILGSTLVEMKTFNLDFIRPWIKSICDNQGHNTSHLYGVSRRETIIQNSSPEAVTMAAHRLSQAALEGDDSQTSIAKDEDGSPDAEEEITTVKSGLSYDDLKGLEPLVNWAKGKGRLFTPEAKEYGFTSYPRGVILTGVPGCGKTMAAKTIASEWNMKYKRVENKDIVSRFIGGGEEKLAALLEELKANAPIVCFVDEAEKMFAEVRTDELYQAGDAGRDGTESILLQFMEEDDSGVFFIFTSNDLGKMSPALVDRFDERFFIDMPSQGARCSMIASMLRERKKDSANFQIEILASNSAAFTGRDIRYAIDEAMTNAFTQGIALTDDHLLAAFKVATPTSATHQDHIQGMRELVLNGNIRSANTVENSKAIQPAFDPSVN